MISNLDSVKENEIRYCVENGSFKYAIISEPQGTAGGYMKALDLPIYVSDGKSILSDQIQIISLDSLKIIEVDFDKEV